MPYGNKQDYANAAIAVAAGTASEKQILQNNEMAKIAGSAGQTARDAQKAAGKK